MRDLLFVAHAAAFAALAAGLRSWLNRGAQPAAARPPRDPAAEERYRAVIAELAELERQKERGTVIGDAYETRRKALIDTATQLKRT